MATQHIHNDMLNEHLTNKLMWKEQIKRNYFLTQIQKAGGIDNTWRGGDIPVPFMSHAATNVKVGGLVAQSNINHAKYVRGTLTGGYKEISGALKFYDRDLKEHDGKYSEASFLDNLLGQINDMENYIKDIFSIMVLNNGCITTITSGHASGVGAVVFAHPERLQNNQYIEINNGTTATNAYIKSLNINTGAATLVTTSNGSSTVDLSAAGYSAGVKVYVPGAYSNGFNTMPAALLSAAAGGPSTIHGVTKLDSPFTQALNIDATSWTTSNMLEKLFDANTLYGKRVKGKDVEYICSLTFLGAVMKKLESGSGAYRHIDTEAFPFGYTKVKIGGVKGVITLVAVDEKDDDSILCVDWSAWKFHTYEGFKRMVDANGNNFYVVRDDTDGYIYITDILMYGQTSCVAPWKNMIIHSIPTSIA